MEQSTPTSMRFLENTAKENEKQKAEGTYTRKLFEDVELHQKYDQEHFRFAQLPFTSQLWLHILQLGKIGCIIFPPILIYIHFLSISQSRESWQAVTLELLQEVYPIFLGIPLLCWGLGHVVVNHFPKIWFRPPKGPLWELNRRTGLVTIFDYKRHRKEGVIDEFIAPFYEFDAYMLTTRDRFGSNYGLLLRHRYEDRQINFHSLLGPDDFKHRPCALWDFLQNYMDVSRPIPDIPLFEAYRHLDPVTAKYDKENGRNPRYWIDMDDDTFKQRVDAMWQRACAIDTFTRPNLMERYVSYND
ncbi:hypothetical protein V2K52_17060 [Pseudomonas alliivorans]|nr:hypothetical protein [Pseudomonas alliivorans]MEE4789216.1 hypothetical protein [Pseudomonas alliivorans]MEE4793821.1 hypothetical protein [Pseudomonas alliivorans]MEE4796240.1 hypothetical protein [Pseudomonas alliivorans]MEE4806896.1 hypothetical protein [Pseudomonas alliivorans]